MNRATLLIVLVTSMFGFAAYGDQASREAIENYVHGQMSATELVEHLEGTPIEFYSEIRTTVDLILQSQESDLAKLNQLKNLEFAVSSQIEETRIASRERIGSLRRITMISGVIGGLWMVGLDQLDSAVGWIQAAVAVVAGGGIGLITGSLLAIPARHSLEREQIDPMTLKPITEACETLLQQNSAISQSN